MIPLSLQEAIEQYLSTQSIKKLKKDFEHISHSYRHLDCKHTGSTKDDVDAYLVGRLPLTFSVIKDVLCKTAHLFPTKVSVTDYGCGPATALFALHEVFDDVTYHGLEEKKAMLEAAKTLSKALGINAEFTQSDIQKDNPVSTSLALASYVLNELKNPHEFYKLLLSRHDYILILEPGTPDGYQRINTLRNLALDSSWHILAPCPHECVCPIKNPSWCHFYNRVARSKQLKELKGGQLGYEDEKYCYLFLSKTKQPVHHSVLLKEPTVLPFKVELTVCDSDGFIKDKEILKKDKDRFKLAKKLSWGDFI